MELSSQLSIYERMYKIRKFELRVRDVHQDGKIKIPIYLGVGQESIAATISEIFSNGIPIFAQHRSHSYFISFGGDLSLLRDELLSREETWDKGAGGSASISSESIEMFGHSGFMGDQIPIAAGFSLVKKRPVLGIVGDASVEEDYVLATLGFIAKRRIPMLLICEDNNLSILTKVEVRRDWNLAIVASSFGCEAHEINDHPKSIWEIIKPWNQMGPLVINVKTTRHLWHSGSGQDEVPVKDTLNDYKLELLKFVDIKHIEDIEARIDCEVDAVWTGI